MTWPTVTEQPLRLEPTSRDPFLDGLTGDLAWSEPSTTQDRGAPLAPSVSTSIDRAG